MELNTLLEQFKATSFIEWVAFLFGVAQVVLAWLKKTENFYAGLFSVLLYTYVFYKVGLFAESLLNAYYVWMSVWGIVVWKKENTSLPIASCSFQQNQHSALGALLTWGLLYFVLTQFTSSSVPLLDALVSALAWVGSFLLVKRKIENWLWLTASNLLAIFLQLYKGMPLTALLTLIYLGVGILGFYDWRKQAQSIKP